MNGPVTVQISEPAITVQIPPQNPITVVIAQPAITITGNLTMNTYIPFSFEVTQNNQTVFGPLQQTGGTILTVAIAGALQNQAIGDFTFSNGYITLSQGLPLISGTPIYVYGVQAI